MPKNKDIKKVLVIGSGPIIIGQAAEFDYAGTQACRELRKEGIEVVLINSNPATIMTDKEMADEIYIEPITVKTVEKIIRKEKPDSILPNLGGQTGLNIAMELYERGFLKENNVRLLGTSPEGIKNAEDRQAFKDMMESINEPCIASKVVTDVEDAVEFANRSSSNCKTCIYIRWNRWWNCTYRGRIKRNCIKWFVFIKSTSSIDRKMYIWMERN